MIPMIGWFYQKNACNQNDEQINHVNWNDDHDGCKKTI